MLKELVLSYEDSIIDEEKQSIQTNKYLRIERYMRKNNLSDNDLLIVLEEIGACSPMSAINDWYIDLCYRLEVK